MFQNHVNTDQIINYSHRHRTIYLYSFVTMLTINIPLWKNNISKNISAKRIHFGISESRNRWLVNSYARTWIELHLKLLHFRYLLCSNINREAYFNYYRSKWKSFWVILERKKLVEMINKYQNRDLQHGWKLDSFL